MKQDFEAEVKRSQALQATAKLSSSTSTAPAASGPVPEELEKNEASLRLYEDFTDLQIYNVQIKQGEKKGSKETTYNCVQTVDGHSQSFIEAARRS